MHSDTLRPLAHAALTTFGTNRIASPTKGVAPLSETVTCCDEVQMQVGVLVVELVKGINVPAKNFLLLLELAEADPGITSN